MFFAQKSTNFAALSTFFEAHLYRECSPNEKFVSKISMSKNKSFSSSDFSKYPHPFLKNKGAFKHAVDVYPQNPFRSAIKASHLPRKRRLGFPLFSFQGRK